MTGQQERTYDVVVVGGGAAGLSGALALARARRSVLVIDAGSPRNAPAAGVHNYLGREDTPPGELLAAGRAEVESYGGEVLAGAVASAGRHPGADDEFRLELADGTTVRGRRLLVATGLVDELPDLPGIAEQWGAGVLSCPYCHGWEVRDQALGVLATGTGAAAQALLFRQWSADVTLFLHAAPDPSDEQWEQLAARGIRVVDGRVEALEVSGGEVTGVRLRSGAVFPLHALVVQPRMRARTGVLASLGLEPEPLLMGDRVVGDRVAAEAAGATAVPGVWVAGNVTDLLGGVLTAAAAGLVAAMAINADLVAADTRLAVAAARAAGGYVGSPRTAFSPQSERTVAERVLGDRRHGLDHGPGGDHAAPPPVQFTPEFWDERYASVDALWSGDANAQLVAEASDLRPGRALDLGSGEGADAIWLAARGWHVTALDVSRVALVRGAAHAERAGADVARRIDWVYADLIDGSPGDAAYDLVSAQFMHLPAEPRTRLLRRSAALVAPGGTLLVVGHDPQTGEVAGHRSHFPELLFTAAEIADLLDPAEWKVLVAQARPRAAVVDGAEVTIHDAVLRAQRL